MEFDHLSRPLRRALARWVGRLADRLLQFRDQIRFGFIELISSSVAETVGDALHRPFDRGRAREAREALEVEHQFEEAPRYLAGPDHLAGADRGHPRRLGLPLLDYPPGAAPPPRRPGETPWHRWFGALRQHWRVAWQWLVGPGLPSVLATSVTLVSLLSLLP